jgi:hypothetical protein
MSIQCFPYRVHVEYNEHDVSITHLPPSEQSKLVQQPKPVAAAIIMTRSWSYGRQRVSGVSRSCMSERRRPDYNTPNGRLEQAILWRKQQQRRKGPSRRIGRSSKVLGCARNPNLVSIQSKILLSENWIILPGDAAAAAFSDAASGTGRRHRQASGWVGGCRGRHDSFFLY